MLVTQPSEHRIETVIHAQRYELTELISTGQRAQIWTARELATGRDVVVKIARCGTCFDGRALLVAMQGLPNAVRPIDHGELLDGRCYVVSERVDGVALRTMLARRVIDRGDAVSILESLARALEAAHARGVAHGAVTPEHVLLAEGTTDGWCAVHLLGLGSNTGAPTPGYAAPEQLAGERASAASDVFAFAALAIELFTGCSPLSTNTLDAARHAARRLAGLAPRIELPADLEHLEPILRRALDRDPAARPELAELVSALTGAPVPSSRRFARGSAMHLVAAVALAITASACEVGSAETGALGPDGGMNTDETAETTEIESTTLKIFDPANYAGYDPTGASESSAAFQAAIDAASAYAANGGTGVYRASTIVRSDGTVVGPNAPQAVVRTRAHGVFKLLHVYMKPDVRLEIDASSTLIPVHADQQVMLYGLVKGSNADYVDNITITSYGTSSTFQDTGRRCRLAGLVSPCALAKKVKYANMTFPDGMTWTTASSALQRRFVIDLDYRRYPDTNPPAGSGQGPRGSGIKLFQARYFLVENVLELANPGEVRYPNDTPSGPGGIGSNTYPATAGNGLAIDALPPGPGETPDMTAGAIQPRNGTVRYMHCEGCTRGYGIMEIHAGVDLDYAHVSTHGGIAVRWESAGVGQSTRQHATQIVGYDCNSAVLMSPHENIQVELQATYVKAIGCDTGFRSESPGGDTKRSTVSHIDVYGGTSAQVIKCRFASCDSKYGSTNYDDDAWTFAKSEYAIDDDNTRSTSSITISNVRCTAASTFVNHNVGYGSCSGL